MKLDFSALPPNAQGADAPGARPSVAGIGADTLAWRREMERAQAQTWFKDALPHTTVVAGMNRSDTVPASAVETPRARSSATAPMPTAVASSHDHLHFSSTMEHGHSPSSIALPGNPPLPIQRETLVAMAGDVVVRADCDAPKASGVSTTEVLRTANDLQHPMAMIAPAWNTPPEPARTPLPSMRTDGEAPSEPGDAPQRSFTRTVRLASLPPVRLHVEPAGTGATVWLGIDVGAELQLPDIVRSLAGWLGGAGYRTVNWVCNGRAINAPVLLGDATVLPSIGATEEPQSFDMDTLPPHSLIRRESP